MDSSTDNMVSLLIIVSLILLLLMIFIVLRIGRGSLKKGGGTLLITAHPDDECMFFAPTILHLKSCGERVKILCLSEGTLL